MKIIRNILFFTILYVTGAVWAADTIDIGKYVVTTGTGTEKILLETPVRTELVSREEIVSSSAETLADAIEFTNGVRVESNCQNCNFSQIRMLGLEGSYSQILINGQPLMSSLATVYGVEQIPSAMIERVEVVKGGGSALYGPGSIGGVVNVITRDPLENLFEAEVSYGTIEGEDSGDVTSINVISHLRSADENLSATFYYQYDDTEGVDIDGDGFTEISEKELEAFGFSINRYFESQKSRLTFDYNLISEDRRGGDQLDVPEYMAEVAEAVDAKNQLFNLVFEDKSSDSFQYELALSHALLKRDSYYGAGMDPNAYGESESPVDVVDLRFHNIFTDHIISWGAQYNKEELEDEQPAYQRFTDESYDNTGFMIQDDWTISDQMELITGLRLDKHSEIDDAVFSPRIGFKYAFEDNLTMRATIASGFKAPQIFDEDLHIEIVNGGAMLIVNDDDLEEEKSVSYNLSLEYRPVIGEGYGLFEANLFYTDIEDSFFLDETDDPVTEDLEMTRINRGASEVKGVELNFGYQKDNINMSLGLVKQSSEFADQEDDFGETDYFRTPEEYGVFKFYWNNPNLVDLFIGVKYTGEMKAPHYAGYIAEDLLEITDTFLTFDLSVSKTFIIGEDRSLTVALVGKNITDEFQDDLDQGADRDAGYLYGPRFPRSWYLKGKISL